MKNLITDNIDIWTSAQIQKNGAGRGNGSANQTLYGIKKLRELILELAVRGKLVPQDPKDEPASVLLEKIAKEKARLIKEGKIKKEKPLPEITEDEKLFELPKGWAYTRNGCLFRLRKGKNPKILSEENIGYPYLDIEALDRDNIQRYTNDEKCPRSTDKDILVVCDGSRSGLVLNGKNGVVGSTLAVIDTPSLIQAYVKLLFQEAFQRLNTTMKGAAIPHLDTKNLIIEIIGLPPHKEQLRIIAKVDELMALCDKLGQQQTDSNALHQTLVETLLATLTSVTNANEFKESWQRIADNFNILFTTEKSIDQLKQTILQLAVMGKLVPQDPKDEPASVLLDKIITANTWLSEKGIKIKKLPLVMENVPYNLPASWIWCKSENLFNFEQGIQIDKDMQLTHMAEGYKRFLRIIDYTQDTDDIRYVKDPGDKYLVDKDNLVMVRYGASAGFIGSNKKGILANNLFKIIYGILNKEYIIKFFQSSYFIQELQKNTQGAAMPSINFKFLNNLLFPLPPLAEQHRIVAKVDELMALCDRVKARLQEAQTTQIHLADAIVEEAVG